MNLSKYINTILDFTDTLSLLAWEKKNNRVLAKLYKKRDFLENVFGISIEKREKTYRVSGTPLFGPNMMMLRIFDQNAMEALRNFPSSSAFSQVPEDVLSVTRVALPTHNFKFNVKKCG